MTLENFSTSFLIELLTIATIPTSEKIDIIEELNNRKGAN